MPLIVAAFALVMWLFAMSIEEDADKQAFKARCDAQHGTVLMPLKSNGNRWIGCYSGVKEIPNEV